MLMNEMSTQDEVQDCEAFEVLNGLDLLHLLYSLHIQMFKQNWNFCEYD